MDYKDRFTRLVSDIEDSYRMYFSYNFSGCIQQLGAYEDFGLTPKELAKVLSEYEMQQPREQWDLDKLEKWQQIIKNYDKIYFADNDTYNL